MPDIFPFLMWKKSISNKLQLFTFNAFFLTWIITLSQDSIWSSVTRRHRRGMAHVCQIKLHASTETFPKIETGFPFAHFPSCFCPRNPKLLWFAAAHKGPKAFGAFWLMKCHRALNLSSWRQLGLSVFCYGMKAKHQLSLKGHAGITPAWRQKGYILSQRTFLINK